MPDRPDVELARAAASGDGAAFAALYDRYELRVYTFCLRLTGSRDDAADATQEAFVKVLARLPRLEPDELNFAAYVYTAARHAAYDAMSRGRRAELTAELEEAGAGAGAGSLHAPPGGDLFEDPERSALLDSTQKAVRAANERLSPRQREVLVLRELEELSYDEIAEIMGTNRNTVAQLIFRARVRLRDELRGSALSSVAASTPDCERALALLAMRQDGELESAGADAAWLRAHVDGCATCPVASEVMEEAGMSYRAWLPVVPLLALREDAFASVGESVGADWSQWIREPAAGAGRSEGSEGGAPHRPGRRRGRVAAGAGVLCACILLTGVVSGSDDPPPVPGGLEDSAAAGLLGARPASRDGAPVLGDVSVEGDISSGAPGRPGTAGATNATELPALLAPVLPPRAATERDQRTPTRRTDPVRGPATGGSQPGAAPAVPPAAVAAPTDLEAAPAPALEPVPAEPAPTHEQPAPARPPRDPAGGGTTPPVAPPRSAGP